MARFSLPAAWRRPCERSGSLTPLMAPRAWLPLIPRVKGRRARRRSEANTARTKMPGTALVGPASWAKAGSATRRAAGEPTAGSAPRRNAVDQVRGGVGHAPAAAGGTEAATFAGEGDDAIGAALVAVHAHEPVGEDAAAEIGAELPFHEARMVRSRDRARARSSRALAALLPLGNANHGSWPERAKPLQDVRQ